MPQFSSAPNAHARETMLRSDERQRVVLADKMADMANLIAAALVVGFAIGEPAASARVAATAIGFWVGALAAVMALSRSKQ